MEEQGISMQQNEMFLQQASLFGFDIEPNNIDSPSEEMDFSALLLKLGQVQEDISVLKLKEQEEILSFKF